VLLNFREPDRTFYIPIRRLFAFRDTSGKKSINVADAAQLAEYELGRFTLRTRKRYDIRGWLDTYKRPDERALGNN
jgi:hypothetical protein